MQVKDLSLHDVLRYAYGGILFTIAAFLIDRPLTLDIKDMLGPVVWPVAVLVTGAALYLFFRASLGEWMLFYVLVWWEGYWQRGGHCKYRYVADTVPLVNDSPFEARRAFRLLRTSGAAYSQEAQAQFHREHSELHLLYLTGFVLLISACWYGLKHASCCGTNISWPFWILLGSAVICIVTGLRHDVALDSREHDQMASSTKKEQWKELCKNAGMAK